MQGRQLPETPPVPPAPPAPAAPPRKRRFHRRVRARAIPGTVARQTPCGPRCARNPSYSPALRPHRPVRCAEAAPQPPVRPPAAGPIEFSARAGRLRRRRHRQQPPWMLVAAAPAPATAAPPAPIIDHSAGHGSTRPDHRVQRPGRPHSRATDRYPWPRPRSASSARRHRSRPGHPAAAHLPPGLSPPRRRACREFAAVAAGVLSLRLQRSERLHRRHRRCAAGHCRGPRVHASAAGCHHQPPLRLRPERCRHPAVRSRRRQARLPPPWPEPGTGGRGVCRSAADANCSGSCASRVRCLLGKCEDQGRVRGRAGSRLGRHRPPKACPRRSRG